MNNLLAEWILNKDVEWVIYYQSENQKYEIGVDNLDALVIVDYMRRRTHTTLNQFELDTHILPGGNHQILRLSIKA
jgi:hypothetical protein